MTKKVTKYDLDHLSRQSRGTISRAAVGIAADTKERNTLNSEIDKAQAFSQEPDVFDIEQELRGIPPQVVLGEE